MRIYATLALLAAAPVTATLATPTAAHAQSRYVQISRPIRGQELVGPKFLLTGRAAGDDSVRVRIYDQRNRLVYNGSTRLDGPTWRVEPSLRNRGGYRAEVSLSRSSSVRDSVSFRIAGEDGGGDNWTGERLRIDRPRSGETVGDRRVLIQGIAKPGSDLKLEVFDARTGRRVAYQMLAVPDRGRGRWETRVPLDAGREYRVKLERNRGEDREEMRFRTEAPPKMPR